MDVSWAGASLSGLPVREATRDAACELGRLDRRKPSNILNEEYCVGNQALYLNWYLTVSVGEGDREYSGASVSVGARETGLTVFVTEPTGNKKKKQTSPT
jgi:hypothetical protein